MRAAPFARGFFVGDYSGLTAAGGTFKPFFAAVGATGVTTDVFATTVRAPFGPPPPPVAVGAPAPAPRVAPSRPLTLRVRRGGSLRGGAAYVRFRCARTRGSCRGTLRLAAFVRSRGARRLVTLGARSFRVKRGATARLRVPLSRRARAWLRRSERVVGQVHVTMRDERTTFPVVLRRR